jgi:23S rRNA A2030 N6-methylase RlmJ
VTLYVPQKVTIMANIHFGRIGDIWKHLPLAEILAIEAPQQIWESHAGSALYRLTRSVERDYGVYYFYEHALNADALAESTYYKVLKNLEKDGQLEVYPGSPYLDLNSPSKEVGNFVFCDKDHDSLANIQSVAQQLGIPDTCVHTIHGDGLRTLAQLGVSLDNAPNARVFAHIDPYEPMDESESGLTSFDLLCQLSKRGIQCVLWYGYNGSVYRQKLFDRLDDALKRQSLDPHSINLWCGDIALQSMSDPSFESNSGVISCGILCSNLSGRSITACDRLGNALQQVYASARLATGHTGALQYSSLWL